MKPNGYIVHETRNTVAIATGFASRSHNAKTGDMVQIWIIRKDIDPLDAVRTGKDKAICFDCPFRPALGGDCYVNVAQAPKAIWKAYKRGNYPKLTDYTVFRERMVRFGAYGEPVLIPYETVATIASHSKGWTGYTHQWRKEVYQPYRRFFMASCNEADYATANAQGWRAFIVTDTVMRLDGSAPCPASKEAGKRVNCADCGACSGTFGKGNRNINIAKH